MTEVWKDIEGYEGVYQISNLGRVKSMRRAISNGKGIFMTSEFIMKSATNGDGYPTISLQVGGRKNRKSITVHLLVARAFIKNLDNNKNQVNHKDGVKTNNVVSNLEWVTQGDNIRHAWEHGLNTAHRGEAHGCSKLTWKEVREIRKLRSTTKLTQREIGKRFNVGHDTVSRIVLNKLWKI